MARFIADQRTFYRMPYAVTCAILGVMSPGCTSGCIPNPPTLGETACGEARYVSKISSQAEVVSPAVPETGGDRDATALDLVADQPSPQVPDTA